MEASTVSGAPWAAEPLLFYAMEDSGAYIKQAVDFIALY